MMDVDFHEEQSGIPKLLSVSYDYKNLPAGDYGWYDLDNRYLLVERKSLSDFMGSIADGRLREPIDRLREAADISFLLIEGIPVTIAGKVGSSTKIQPWRKGIALLHYRPTGWHVNSVLAEQWGMILGAGLLPLWTVDKAHTARLLSAAYKSSQKEAFGFPKYAANRWIGSNANPTLKSYATVLPLVDAKLAARLLEKYPTWRSLCHAQVKGLTSIQGIGKLRAERIIEFLGGRDGTT